MQVTSEGQVTIPLQLLEKAGILPGSEVEAVEENGRVYLRILSFEDRGRLLVERMTGKGDIRLTTDEIMAMTRGDD